MSDNQIYYYMRLKESFFDSDELIILESMEDGYIYSNILLKLYLRSLKRQGKLMLNDVIPYNVEILSKVTRHSKEVTKKALEVFKSLGLIEILDTGAIYMLNIQEYIGKSSTEADRKRKYRERIENDKCPDKSEDKCPDKSEDKCPDNIQTNIHYNKNKVREEKELENTLFNSLTLKEGDAHPPSAAAGGAPPFTLMDCQECADEGIVNLSEDGIIAFYNRMQKEGWKIKGNPVTNLLLAMRGFAKNHKRYQKQAPEKRSVEFEYQLQEKQSDKDKIEAGIYKVASNYISKRLFGEKPGGHHCLIRDYCPKEAFTEEQLEYMASEWCVWPRLGKHVFVDEYMKKDNSKRTLKE